MLKVVAVHHKDRDDRLPLPKDWDIWETDTEIGETYSNLATHAIEAEWGHEVVVAQDDVRFVVDPNEVELTTTNLAIIAYGQTTRKHHVCPRAFSADEQGWVLLRDTWKRIPGTLCPGFTWAVNFSGVVLDVTELSHG